MKDQEIEDKECNTEDMDLVLVEKILKEYIDNNKVKSDNNTLKALDRIENKEVTLLSKRIKDCVFSLQDKLMRVCKDIIGLETIINEEILHASYMEVEKSS